MVFRLALTGLVIAIKFNEDLFYQNKVYAEIGGITAQELAFLEKEFLKMIEFDLLVTRALFNDIYATLLQNFSCKKKTLTKSHSTHFGT